MRVETGNFASPTLVMLEIRSLLSDRARLDLLANLEIQGRQALKTRPALSPVLTRIQDLQKKSSVDERALVETCYDFSVAITPPDQVDADVTREVRDAIQELFGHRREFGLVPTLATTIAQAEEKWTYLVASSQGQYTLRVKFEETSDEKGRPVSPEAFFRYEIGQALNAIRREIAEPSQPRLTANSGTEAGVWDELRKKRMFWLATLQVQTERHEWPEMIDIHYQPIRDIGFPLGGQKFRATIDAAAQVLTSLLIQRARIFWMEHP